MEAEIIVETGTGSLRSFEMTITLSLPIFEDMETVNG
jgi:hypothetical protein|tara:strand:- start:739 stop:849 length:111 start_codon:yes stop_codon:yes gene_type:complete